MPLRTLCCVLAIVGAAAAAPLAQDQPAASDQETLIALERRWNDAFYKKDVDFIRSLLADDFVATYEDGTRGTKASELALIAGFNQDVRSAVQDEFEVRVYRDAAVVRFTLHLVGIKEGVPAEVALRYTDVWVMRDGRWLCVSSQSTKVR